MGTRGWGARAAVISPTARPGSDPLPTTSYYAFSWRKLNSMQCQGQLLLVVHKAGCICPVYGPQSGFPPASPPKLAQQRPQHRSRMLIYGASNSATAKFISHKKWLNRVPEEYEKMNQQRSEWIETGEILLHDRRHPGVIVLPTTRLLACFKADVFRVPANCPGKLQVLNCSKTLADQCIVCERHLVAFQDLQTSGP